MAKGQPARKPRGRPALPANKGKRHSVGIRTTKQLKDLLQSAAESEGRSLAQEIEIRLERSFERERTLAEDMTDALGGPRPAALFRALAGQALLWSGDDGWLDDYAGFNTVRDMWNRTLKDRMPAMPDSIAHRIEQGRSTVERLRVDDLSADLRGRLRTLLGLLADDTSLPAQVRAEFAAAAADKEEPAG